MKPIDLSKRVFRRAGGERAGLPQERGMPPERERQDHKRQGKPDRQPDERAAEGFFGAAPVPQGAQHHGKEQADEAVAEVERDALERKHRRAATRFGQSIQIIREDKPDGDHGRAEREGEHDTPPPPAQRKPGQGSQSNDCEPGEVSQWRDPLYHAARDRRDEKAKCTEPRPDQTVTRCRQIDQAEIRTGEGQEQPGHGVQQQSRKNHEECKRHPGDPQSGVQHRPDRGFPGGQGAIIGLGNDTREFTAWLPHAEGDKESERGSNEVEKNWKAQRGALGESEGASESASGFVHEPGVVNRATDEHGDDEAHRLPARDLVEDVRPFRGSSALREGVKHQRLVSSTRQALGDAAEQSIRQANKKKQRAPAQWSHAKHCHFHHHKDGGPDHQRPTADPIRESAGRQVRANDGDGPGEIQQRVLRRAKAKVKEQHRQHRVIEPRVEEYAKKDKAPPVTVGRLANIRSAHASAILTAFAFVATAFRHSQVAFISVILAANFLLAGVAHSQQPGPARAPAGTRLVVGLTQAPPFSIRGTDGTWSGISVELWQWIAADLGIETEFRESTVTGVFDGLAPGGPLDVSIGALTITAEREDRVDFTQPFFVSGLGVAVKTAPETGGLWLWLNRVLASNFWRILAGLLVSLVFVALLIWALEHRTNPKEFGGDGKAYRGIGSALWWSAVTMTTVGYGDLAPRSPAGRLVAIAWMFVSLFLVSWFTASMASILTAERLDAGPGGLVVRGADDLRRLRVAAIPGTSSEDYLRRHQIDYLRLPLNDLLEALLTGRAQAVLMDATPLRYIARSERYAGKITVLPQTFQKESYGIALRNGSPWRKPVNRALLHRLEDPAWRDLVYRYVGSAE